MSEKTNYEKLFRNLYGRDPERGELKRIEKERRRNNMSDEELQQEIFEQIRKETKAKYEEKKQAKTVDELFGRNRR